MSSGDEALSELELSVLKLCRENPKGLHDNTLEEKLPAVSVEERSSVINALLGKRRLQIFKSDQSDQLVYKEFSRVFANKLKGLGSEETLVYQIIQAGGNMGIWTKELKMQSNLQQPQISKILRSLEGRQLIKAVKSVASKNRKVYMLYELEPSREITGGAWYTEQEFDGEFISVLTDLCHKFIVRSNVCTLGQIAEFVSSSQLSKVKLELEDVLSIVNTLVFDGKVEEVASESAGSKLATQPREGYAADKMRSWCYKASRLETPVPSPFTSSPCGVCPVFNECTPDGMISPARCVYFSQWLQF